MARFLIVLGTAILVRGDPRGNAAADHAGCRHAGDLSVGVV